MASHLTGPEAQLIAEWLTALGGVGNALTKSREQMLAEIRNIYGGSVSHLTTKVADLIASIDTAAGGSGDARTESIVKGIAGINAADGGGGNELSLGFAALLASIVNNVDAVAYTTQAVLFNGDSLHIDSLTAADSGLLSCSFWIRHRTSPYSMSSPLIDNQNSQQGVLLDSIVQSSWFDSAFANEFTLQTDWGASSPLGDDGWANIRYSVDVGHAAESRVFQLYLGDTNIASQIQSDTGVPFVIPFSGVNIDLFAAVGFGSGNPGDASDFDIADFWFAPGQFIDFSVEANRRKFIDASGKPVNLGADGSTPTGTAPAVFFKRDGAASTFATNRGTGGVFTLAGTLGDAATSPSD